VLCPKLLIVMYYTSARIAANSSLVSALIIPFLLLLLLFFCFVILGIDVYTEQNFLQHKESKKWKNNCQKEQINEKTAMN
jgi:hypothetical protein